MAKFGQIMDEPHDIMDRECPDFATGDIEDHPTSEQTHSTHSLFPSHVWDESQGGLQWYDICLRKLL